MLLRWGPVDNINLPLCLLTRRSLLSSCPYINNSISQIIASGIYFWKKAGQTRPAALRAVFMVGLYSGKGLMNTSNTSDTLTHSCSWVPVPLLPFRRYFPPIFPRSLCPHILCNLLSPPSFCDCLDPSSRCFGWYFHDEHPSFPCHSTILPFLHHHYYLKDWSRDAVCLLKGGWPSSGKYKYDKDTANKRRAVSVCFWRLLTKYWSGCLLLRLPEIKMNIFLFNKVDQRSDFFLFVLKSFFLFFCFFSFFPPSCVGGYFC